MDIGLFLLHVVVGLLLFGHGAQKLFGWFGGQGIGRAGEFMQSLGLRPGRLHAVAGGVGEVVGRLLIALGLFLPVAAALVIAVMVTATVAVHWRNGLWAQNGGLNTRSQTLQSRSPSPGRARASSRSTPRSAST